MGEGKEGWEYWHEKLGLSKEYAKELERIARRDRASSEMGSVSSRPTITYPTSKMELPRIDIPKTFTTIGRIKPDEVDDE